MSLSKGEAKSSIGEKSGLSALIRRVCRERQEKVMVRFYSDAGLRVAQGHWPAAAGQTTGMPRPIAAGDYDKAAVQAASQYERLLSAQATFIRLFGCGPWLLYAIPGPSASLQDGRCALAGQRFPPPDGPSAPVGLVPAS